MEQRRQQQQKYQTKEKEKGKRKNLNESRPSPVTIIWRTCSPSPFPLSVDRRQSRERFEISPTFAAAARPPEEWRRIIGSRIGQRDRSRCQALFGNLPPNDSVSEVRARPGFVP